MVAVALCAWLEKVAAANAAATASERRIEPILVIIILALWF